MTVENARDAIVQRRQFGLNHVPLKVKINAEVVMDQSISHAGHRPPFDIGVCLTHFRRDSLGASPMISRHLTAARCSVGSAMKFSYVNVAVTEHKNVASN